MSDEGNKEKEAVAEEGGEEGGGENAGKPKETKTEEEPAKTEAPSAIDDAVNAAEGTRTAARWIASALGSIPGLAIVAAIVRAPGDAGFDGSELIWGVLLAAVGAFIAIVAFANVLAPAAIEEKDLTDIDVNRVPGHPFRSYAELSRVIDALKRVKGDGDIEAGDAQEAAAKAERLADLAEADAARLSAELKKDANNEELKKKKEAAEQDASRLREQANAAAALVAEKVEEVGGWGEQLARREALRVQFYRLKGADRIRNRFIAAVIISFFAVGAIALGLALIGLAPIPKSEDTPAAEPVSLLTLHLNDAGKKELDCQLEDVKALKVGGDADVPEVITLPTQECPTPKELPFVIEKPKELGTATPTPTDTTSAEALGALDTSGDETTQGDTTSSPDTTDTAPGTPGGGGE